MTHLKIHQDICLINATVWYSREVIFF